MHQTNSFKDFMSSSWKIQRLVFPSKHKFVPCKHDFVSRQNDKKLLIKKCFPHAWDSDLSSWWIYCWFSENIKWALKQYLLKKCLEILELIQGRSNTFINQPNQRGYWTMFIIPWQKTGWYTIESKSLFWMEEYIMLLDLSFLQEKSC